MTRILIIDDEPLQLELIADRIGMEFNKDEVAIDKVHNLELAKPLLEKNKYHLIITDLMMGDYNAKDTVKHLADTYTESPIIVYTVAPEAFPNEYQDHKRTFLMDKLKPFEDGMIELVNHLVGNHKNIAAN